MSSWNPRANAVFADATEISGAQARAEFVARECGEDVHLRQQVESLLATAESAKEFLNRPAVTSDFRQAERVELEVGSTIGSYKILQEIGEGGFGIVYMAQQREPVRRRVALKIIKPGMDTRDVIARFEAERQALALMDHPNIAQVFDAGTTSSGRPYFVMELVKGIPITEFCDANKFDTRARIELFETLCGAVQHAHQKGVIHRDLKPSNVMVTMLDGAPLVKIIDFGVAKAINRELTDKTLFTSYGQMIGTPQYMSPEQAGMSAVDVDTRSDVYSLGVLLYELLTGTTPLDGKRLRSSGYAEMQRIIREEEPPKPSTRLSTLGDELKTIALNRVAQTNQLPRQLRGELDWIVMRSLEKDRNRRYESAGSFAKDIRRHLGGQAVEACPPTWRYQAGKFIRQNRVAILFTSILLLAVIGGIIGTTIGLVRASRANEALASINQELEAKNQELANKNDQISKDLVDQAVAAAMANHPERARQLVETAREIGADESILQTILGMAERTVDQEVALAHHQRAIEMNPESVSAHAGLMLHNIMAGDFQDIYTIYFRAEGLPPKTHLDHLFFGMCSSLTARHTKAVEHVEQALKIRSSPAVRIMAAEALSWAALCWNDLPLAERGMQYVNDAALSHDANDYFVKGVQIFCTDVLIVLLEKRGEPTDGLRLKLSPFAANVYADLDAYARTSAGHCLWLAHHYTFVEKDYQRANKVYEKLFEVYQHEFFTTFHAGLLMQTKGIGPAIAEFERLDSGKHSRFSQGMLLALRAISPSEEDRKIAKEKWRRLGDEHVAERDGALLAAAAVGDVKKMRTVAMEWVIEAQANDSVWQPDFVRFIAGELTEEEYINLKRTKDRPIAPSLKLGWLDYAMGDFETARKHFERAVSVGEFVSWHHQYAAAFLAHMDRQVQ